MIVFWIKLDFALAKDKNCVPSYTHNETGVRSYDFLGEAKQYCTKDGDCIGIVDDFCDIKGYRLCKAGTIKHSNVGSCVYTRGNC